MMLKNKPWRLSTQNKSFLFQKIDHLDMSKTWEVYIQEAQDDRTLEQNDRLWELYTSIGNYLGYTKNEIHDLMGWQFLRYQTTVGDVVVEKIRSTTKLKTKAMAEYQEQIEIWASQMGWSW